MAFGGFLRQSTAVDILIGPFLDSSDGNTQETSLTISYTDVLLSKNGQTRAAKNDETACAADSNGYYNCELSATDTNTVGQLAVTIHESGALAVRLDYQVMEETEYDALYKTGANGIASLEELALETASMQYVLDVLMRALLESTLMIKTTIATLTSQTSFTLSAGSPDDDAYNDCLIMIKDESTAKQKAIGFVSDYAASTLTVTLVADPGVFTMGVNDEIFIMAAPWKNANDIRKLVRADKIIDTDEDPWVVDHKEEGTETVLMSKTMKNTAGNDISNADNVLGQLTQE